MKRLIFAAVLAASLILTTSGVWSQQLPFAAALAEQGYPAWLAEVRDGHTWTSWRDSLDPHLPALIEAVS